MQRTFHDSVLRLLLFVIILHVTICGSNKLSLKIVNVALAIKQILLVITFNLYTSQTFLCKVFWIVNVYDVVIILFNLRLALSFKLFLSLLLKS